MASAVLTRCLPQTPDRPETLHVSAISPSGRRALTLTKLPVVFSRSPDSTATYERCLHEDLNFELAARFSGPFRPLVRRSSFSAELRSGTSNIRLLADCVSFGCSMNDRSSAAPWHSYREQTLLTCYEALAV